MTKYAELDKIEEIELNPEEKVKLVEEIAKIISCASDKAKYDKRLLKKLSQFYFGERTLSIDELIQIKDNLIKEDKTKQI